MSISIFLSALIAIGFAQSSLTIQDQESHINKEGINIKERFLPPNGYETFISEEGSFANYLQNLPLKLLGSEVKFFNNSFKENKNIYISVIDMDIDTQDLQQCADAVMRLKGEYHYHKKEYDKIHFNFLSDGKPRFYKQYVNEDYSYKTFRKYMRYIFSYANTASLYHEMERVEDINEMQIGDVFIQKGRPYGHAVIVVNMAINNDTGEKLFMLAQSYMPAQETQILVNRKSAKLSPWYRLESGKISTPEWEFYSSDLRRFKN